jgi:hypothetical protein
MSNGITIETFFTAKSLNEAARQGRKWYAWPLWFFQNLYGILLIVALLWVIVAGAISVGRGEEHNPGRILGFLALLLFIAGIALWSFLSTRKRKRELLTRLNPLKLTFSMEGVTELVPNGSSSFVPWSMYSDFYECPLIFVLRTKDGLGHRPIPKDAVPVEKRAQIRAALLAHLPERP